MFVDFVYWYELKATDVPGTNDSRCGRLQWVDGITIEQKVESCDQRYPFMCQTPASVTGMVFIPLQWNTKAHIIKIALSIIML